MDDLHEVPVPAVVLAGTHSGCGKTTVTIAVIAALQRRGLRVQGFKVGPDFIDPGHHGRLTGRPGRNLDTWLLTPDVLAATYRRATAGTDIAVIEGVMGLFDGRGPNDESGSTADLARVWDLPVVLVVDARGMARSVAPIVGGFAVFDPTVRVAGIIANNVGSARHFDNYLRPSLRAACSDVVPLGYLVRDQCLVVPSRHLGLLTAEEFTADSVFVDALAQAAEATLDLDRLLAIATPPRLAACTSDQLNAPIAGPRKRVAVARDAAFCFYYEDNLTLLRVSGAELVPFSPLSDRSLPENIDLVLLGGGYPEVFAAQIAANEPMRASIRRYHADGGPIYAECGGLMACTEMLRLQDRSEFPMWGLIPARVTMQNRFAALGYVTAATTQITRLGPEGTQVRGHEFHYSTLEPLGPLEYVTTLLRDDRPPRPDGIAVGGLLAGYAHLHFGSNPSVADALLR